MNNPVPISYEDARARFRPGDLTCWAVAHDPCSWIIRWRTGDVVSHVAPIVLSQPVAGGARTVDVIEAAWPTVRRVALSWKVRRYQRYAFGRGRAWWIPMSDEALAQLDVRAYHNYLNARRHLGYDFWGAVGCGLSLRLPLDSPARDYCSELAVDALHAGRLDTGLDYWACSPAEMLRSSIWAPTYYQLVGPPTPFRHYREEKSHGLIPPEP